MKRILLFAALAVVAVTANAQHITGKVIDASSQQPLSGATISIGGKSVATTNANGTFSFDCTATVTISISFVGYESQQQQVNCNASIQVALQLSNNVMENVELTATST
ncbi:MAG: carboxypeptidase-like regulatory domain-containing protein, partial [Chitinophagaceae bacterium]|nr:carboxypeptidase-like regulatory domain-containing protein [Chitinophagaceae bacterium]